MQFEARGYESAGTFLALLNTQGHRVEVACDFYDSSGDLDHRFGFDMFLDARASSLYVTDVGTPQFQKPPPGEVVYARGWFELFASSPIQATAWVMQEKYYVERCRAWAYPLPLQDVSLSKLDTIQHAGMHEGGGIEPIGEARGKVFESTAPWLEVTQEEGAGRGEPPHDPRPR